MSENSYELPLYDFAASTDRTKNELELILGKKFKEYFEGKFRKAEAEKIRSYRLLCSR